MAFGVSLVLGFIAALVFRVVCRYDHRVRGLPHRHARRLRVPGLRDRDVGGRARDGDPDPAAEGCEEHAHQHPRYGAVRDDGLLAARVARVARVRMGLGICEDGFRVGYRARCKRKL